MSWVDTDCCVLSGHSRGQRVIVHLVLSKRWHRCRYLIQSWCCPATDLTFGGGPAHVSPEFFQRFSTASICILQSHLSIHKCFLRFFKAAQMHFIHFHMSERTYPRPLTSWLGAVPIQLRQNLGFFGPLLPLVSNRQHLPNPLDSPYTFIASFYQM